jgi:hypothetical protein
VWPRRAADELSVRSVDSCLHAYLEVMNHLLLIKRFLVSSQAFPDAEVGQNGGKDAKALRLVSKAYVISERTEAHKSYSKHNIVGFELGILLLPHHHADSGNQDASNGKNN